MLNNRQDISKQDVSKQNISKPEQITLKGIVDQAEKSDELIKQNKIVEVRTLAKSTTREINPDKYKSSSTLTPTKRDKIKYFKIFEEYVVDYKSQKQLAEAWDLSYEHVSRIIKWCTQEIGEIEPAEELNITLEQLKRRSQDILIEIKKTKELKLKVLCWQELRKIDMLKAKLNGTLSNALVDMSEKKVVNVNLNSGFDRRTGSKPENLVDVVEANAVIAEDEIGSSEEKNKKNDYGFQHRTGFKKEEVAV